MIGIQKEHFIVGSYTEPQPYLKCNIYKVEYRCADAFARSIGKQLAEGPTELLSDNYYGVVELWPLVYGGD